MKLVRGTLIRLIVGAHGLRNHSAINIRQNSSEAQT